MVSTNTAAQSSLVELTLSAAAMRTLVGENNAHLKYLAERLGIKILQRKEGFVLEGSASALALGEQVLQALAGEVQSGDIDGQGVHLLIQGVLADSADSTPNNNKQENAKKQFIHLRTKKGVISARSAHQNDYVQKILSHDVSFGVGPAGTGKTYLAVACAVDMIERGEIERILLVRPAVEAGEKLGFLPGDLTQKIDPYLRPLYDALYEMLGFERVGKMIERQIIEVAPLAYMRGRTLNHSFVILDEAQNTTPEQMKMFLTRLGFGSRAVITGDMTQVDLPRHHQSGLRHALGILTGIDGIAITHFDAKDVVRHHLVQKIVQAYDKFDEQQSMQKLDNND